MNESKKVARFVKDVSDKFRGHAAVYKVEPPMISKSWNKEEADKAYDYVVCSSAEVMFSGPETYIFGCDEDGNVEDWLELDGSMRNVMSHREVLTEAGYQAPDAAS